MTERLRRLAAWVLVEKWIDHHAYEVVLMRAFFVAVIYDSINWGRTFSEIVAPNGVARIGPLQEFVLWFGSADHLELVRVWIWIPLVLYVVGLVPVPAILAVLLVTVCVGTLENSDGGIGHSYQIVSLILMAQLGSHVYTGFRSRSTDRSNHWLLPGMGEQNHAIHLSKVTIAAAYVVCGVAKLIKSDFLWINKVPLLSVQITKSNLRDYYNNLEEKTDFITTRVPQLIVEYPNIARLFFGCGLAMELTAFLALRGRRWAFCIGISLIAMHLMIDQIMSLSFWTHIFCLAIFYVNLPGIAETWEESSDTDCKHPS